MARNPWKNQESTWHIERIATKPRHFKTIMSSNQIWPTQYDPKLDKLLRELTRKHGMPRFGYTRACFRLGDGYVLKVPYNHAGVQQCSREVAVSDMWHREGSGTPMAVTFWADLRGLRHWNGAVGVISEEVRIPSSQEITYWKSTGLIDRRLHGVDAEQIGVNRLGQIVAYDL